MRLTFTWPPPPVRAAQSPSNPPAQTGVTLASTKRAATRCSSSQPDTEPRRPGSPRTSAPVRMSAPKPRAASARAPVTRAHAADRDIPDPDAATEQVIQKADVLPQRLIAKVGERADRASVATTTNQIRREARGDGFPDWLLHQCFPGGAGVVPAREYSASGPRSG